MISNLNFKKIKSLLVAGATGLTLVGCSKDTDNKKINFNDSKAYTLEQNTSLPFLYTVSSYDASMAKGKVYEMKRILKSYKKKCTPIEFKNYINNGDVTWESLRKTISDSKFDNYHKNLLLNGINNLEMHGFNMDLSVIDYNLKNINIIYKNFDDDDLLGEFNCFDHTITMDVDAKGEKYNIVFLHEMLGHGMTDAYIDDSKVYCSIDKPTFVFDGDNFYGYSLFGEIFTESMAQIIALIANGMRLSDDYRCAYDLTMAELLILCNDNDCSLYDYANKGIDYLVSKMNQNGFKDSYDLISKINYNYESSLSNNRLEFSSYDLMYSYLCDSISRDFEKGFTIDEVNSHISDLFIYCEFYVLPLYDSNNDKIIRFKDDIINMNSLYSDLGRYAYSDYKGLK